MHVYGYEKITYAKISLKKVFSLRLIIESTVQGSSAFQHHHDQPSSGPVSFSKLNESLPRRFRAEQAHLVRGREGEADCGSLVGLAENHEISPDDSF